MSLPARPDKDRNQPARERRRYDSPLRRERAAQTRERIISAGSTLVHAFPAWDWQGLTVRAVAEHAGVSERTIYRHFSTERELHDAVMHRLEQEAGVSYEKLGLDDLAEVTTRAFAALSSFTVEQWTEENPDNATLIAENERRHDALLAAVTRSTTDWSQAQRRTAAAMLDVLWNVPAYERLVSNWQLDSDEATQAVIWVIGLVVDAIRKGQPPGA
jgi:AcrR family transcriptional regulator